VLIRSGDLIGLAKTAAEPEFTDHAYELAFAEASALDELLHRQRLPRGL